MLHKRWDASIGHDSERQSQRNASGARIQWMFTKAKARAKMGRAYPVIASLPKPRTKES
jgi:hypothetical protein